MKQHAPSDRTRVIAYLRVSTDKQADRGISIDAQREKVDLFARLYDLEVTRVIEDAGASAKTLDRPGLQDALRALEAGEADGLLVVKLDRLTRSVADLSRLIETYFQDRFALLSVSEQIDTRTAAGRLVLNVLASVSQWEREAIGERTRDAMAHLRAEGRSWGGPRAPYGARKTEDGRWVECEREGPLVARARALRAEGWSYRRIARELAADGLVSSSGRELNPAQVRRMVG